MLEAVNQLDEFDITKWMHQRHWICTRQTAEAILATAQSMVNAQPGIEVASPVQCWIDAHVDTVRREMLTATAAMLRPDDLSLGKRDMLEKLQRRLRKDHPQLLVALDKQHLLASARAIVLELHTHAQDNAKAREIAHWLNPMERRHAFKTGAIVIVNYSERRQDGVELYSAVIKKVKGGKAEVEYHDGSTQLVPFKLGYPSIVGLNRGPHIERQLRYKDLPKYLSRADVERLSKWAKIKIPYEREVMASGDRVVVNYEESLSEPELYLAEIVEVGNNKATVRFDEGSTAKYPAAWSLTGIVGLAKDQHVYNEEALPLDKLDDYLTNKKALTQLKKPLKHAAKIQPAQPPQAVKKSGAKPAHHSGDNPPQPKHDEVPSKLREPTPKKLQQLNEHVYKLSHRDDDYLEDHTDVHQLLDQLRQQRSDQFIKSLTDDNRGEFAPLPGTVVDEKKIGKLRKRQANQRNVYPDADDRRSERLGVVPKVRLAEYQESIERVAQMRKDGTLPPAPRGKAEPPAPFKEPTSQERLANLQRMAQRRLEQLQQNTSIKKEQQRVAIPPTKTRSAEEDYALRVDQQTRERVAQNHGKSSVSKLPKPGKRSVDTTEPVKPIRLSAPQPSKKTTVKPVKLVKPAYPPVKAQPIAPSDKPNRRASLQQQIEQLFGPAKA